METQGEGEGRAGRRAYFFDMENHHAVIWAPGPLHTGWLVGWVKGKEMDNTRALVYRMALTCFPYPRPQPDRCKGKDRGRKRGLLVLYTAHCVKREDYSVS